MITLENLITNIGRSGAQVLYITGSPPSKHFLPFPLPSRTNDPLGQRRGGLAGKHQRCFTELVKHLKPPPDEGRRPLDPLVAVMNLVNTRRTHNFFSA